MQQQSYNYDDAPAYRIITDVIAKLDSLTDKNNLKSFNTILPLTQVSYAAILESATPAAFVYFGETAEGLDSANQFDEIYFAPFVEILFLEYIPLNNDGTYPDIQRAMLQTQWKVIRNLRVPTDDDSTGFTPPKNTAGQEIWEFRNKDGSGAGVIHKFDIRTKWIQMNRPVLDNFYLHSIQIPAIMANVVSQT